MYEKYYSPQYTKEEFFGINQRACEILKANATIDKGGQKNVNY